MAYDSMLQRRIMGRFATGVSVVTTCYGEELWGMTANAILSVSLDPPLILVSVDRSSQMHEFLKRGKCFAINLLTHAQEELSRRFATTGPKDFSDLRLTTAETGAPIFLDALAFIECQINQVIPGGDHDLFLGEPVAGEIYEGEPLIFYSGKYTQLIPSTAEEDSSLENAYDHYGTF